MDKLDHEMLNTLATFLNKYNEYLAESNTPDSLDINNEINQIIHKLEAFLKNKNIL